MSAPWVRHRFNNAVARYRFLAPVWTVSRMPKVGVLFVVVVASFTGVDHDPVTNLVLGVPCAGAPESIFVATASLFFVSVVTIALQLMRLDRRECVRNTTFPQESGYGFWMRRPSDVKKLMLLSVRSLTVLVWHFRVEPK